MPHRGEVYFPTIKLPPGTSRHMGVVLSPTGLVSQTGNRLFVNVALIRSAVHKNKQPVRPVPGHSILITQAECGFLKRDSFIETHQLFAVPLDDLAALTPVGVLPQPILDAVLSGARRLFS